MFKNLKYTLITALLCLATANAATVAVLEITLASDEEMNLSIEETKFLTDELRRQATISLPKDYSVLTREEIISRVPQTTENLSTAVDIGRAIKSDYVTQGFIGKLGSLFTLTVELYETSSGKLLGYYTKENPDIKGLLGVISENSPTLFAKVTQKEEPAAISTNIPVQSKIKNSFWIALGLDVLGGAAIGLGIYYNAKSKDYYKEADRLYNTAPTGKNDSEIKTNYEKNKKAYEDKQDEMKSAEMTRNILYATGGALLLSGISVHIWF
ncbi:MAG: hypothetical protein LBC87_00815 [Fibromonadaceae bacterium]|jgi:hypothetical protein|nr:hypothetical protein [Fibromonadaceae bacterium]